MSNASALFRSLLIYGLCLPLAVFLGYLLANPMDLATVTVVLIIFFVLTIPLLLRWHHAWLIATWNTTAMLFFVPGKPQVWMGLAFVSLAISLLQYTLNRRMKFLSAPSAVRPVLLLTAVVLLTARLTGGIGARILGGDTYGGKKYFMVLAAILGFFAIINRRIPPKRAGLYVALFFLGSATLAIGNLPGAVSPSLNFIFVLFPVTSLDPFTEQHSVVVHQSLISRLAGLSGLGMGVIWAMLARYGLRGVLDTTKFWRLGLFCSFTLLGLLSGFRSVLVLILMTLALLFYLERLYQTRLLLPLVVGALLGTGLLAAFAPRLPFTVQRSLAVVPFLQLDPMVRLDAEISSGWRVKIWREVLPQIPQYLLVGKGYSFSGNEQQQMRGDREATELVGDYHNGPLSVIVPFGIFGTIAFLWLLVAGIWVLYQNYRFGDPAYQRINTFLFAYFVVRAIVFFAVFGSLHSDLPMFLGLLGLGISLNGGVAKPAVVPQPKVVFNRFRLHPSVRRPVGA
jgi:hypothetical protein